MNNQHDGQNHAHHHHLMAFTWDINIGEFLFPGLKINGVTSFSFLCIVLIFLSVLYEAIKVQQVRSRARTARERLIQNGSCPINENSSLLAVSSNDLNSRQLFLRKFGQISKQAFIFMSYDTLGYILMLTVMVYNVYVFIVVILSLGLGYFLFGHISMKINMENVRARKTQVICSHAPSTSAGNQSNNNDTRRGYRNEMTASSSESGISSDTQLTVQTQVAKIDIHPSSTAVESVNNEIKSNSNIISCHL